MTQHRGSHVTSNALAVTSAWLALGLLLVSGIAACGKSNDMPAANGAGGPSAASGLLGSPASGVMSNPASGVLGGVSGKQ